MNPSYLTIIPPRKTHLSVPGGHLNVRIGSSNKTPSIFMELKPETPQPPINYPAIHLQYDPEIRHMCAHTWNHPEQEIHFPQCTRYGSIHIISDCTDSRRCFHVFWRALDQIFYIPMLTFGYDLDHQKVLFFNCSDSYQNKDAFTNKMKMLRCNPGIPADSMYIRCL